MTHSDVRGLLLDLDGTVYEDGELIPGAGEAIEALRDAGIAIRFVTNTTRMPRAAIVDWLEAMGVRVNENEMFTPLVTAADWLASRGIQRAALLLPEESKGEFGKVSEVSESAEAVIIGDLGPQWTFEAMNRAFRLVLDGAALVALHRNRYWKTAGGLTLDVGPFVAAIEYATGRQATVVGKPSRAMFETAARSMDLDLSALAMVGDDLPADIGGCQALGIRGILVRTGKVRATDLEAHDIEPDLIIDSLASLPGQLLG